MLTQQQGTDGAKHVFVVSEWLANDGCDEKLYNSFKELLDITKANEKGCIRAHVTRQISHPGSPGKSKYNIVLLQEYENIAAFDIHCASDYVIDFIKTNINDPATAIVADGTCRLFTESSE